MRRVYLSIAALYFFAVDTGLLLANQLANRAIHPLIGRTVVEALRASGNKEDTTNLRKEFKNVVEFPLLETSMAKLGGDEGESIIFENRETPPSTGRYATYTLYGKGLRFFNNGISTKIKLRGRFYLTTSSNKPIFTRSPSFENTAFLELKIKNPSVQEENIVHKYRLALRDQQLLKLYRLKVRSRRYAQELNQLRQEIKASSPAEQGRLVDAIFSAIQMLSASEPEFIKPKFATSYERQASKFVEKAYHRGDEAAASSSLGSIEYQITVDKEVRGYRIPKELFGEGFSFSKYFLEDAGADHLVSYPNRARATEFKVPTQVAQLKAEQQSLIHRKLSKNFVTKIFKAESSFKGFTANKGKAGHIRQLIKKYRRNALILADAA